MISQKRWRRNNPKKLPKSVKRVESDTDDEEEEQSKPDKKTDPILSPKRRKSKTLEKLSCGDCKKKFFDFSALEYHRIHQHAIEITPVKNPIAPLRNPPKNEPLKKSTNEPLIKAPEPTARAAKESTSKMAKIQEAIPRDCRVSLNKDSARVSLNKDSALIRPSRDSAAAILISAAASRTGSKTLDLLSQKPKKSIYSDLSSSEDSSVDEILDDAITKKRKKVEKLVTTLKKRKIEDMNDKELPFVTPKNEKVSCELCGRTLVNQAVLDYHVIHCTGGKRKNSRDSMDSLLNGVVKENENEKVPGPVIEDISEDGDVPEENLKKLTAKVENKVRSGNTKKQPIVEDISEDGGEDASEDEDSSEDDIDLSKRRKVQQQFVRNGR